MAQRVPPPLTPIPVPARRTCFTITSWHCIGPVLKMLLPGKTMSGSGKVSPSTLPGEYAERVDWFLRRIPYKLVRGMGKR